MKRSIFNILSLIVLSLVVYSFSGEVAFKETKSNLFKVIKVNGKILFVKTGQGLKTGDAYVNGTPLSFASNRDRAAIINKIKGRYVLQPNQKGKAIVLPATSNVDSRRGTALLNLLDVTNYFSDSLVFFGEVNLTMGKEAFPLDDEHFFYVTYMFGKERIAKKIDYVGQNLKISESKLFEIDGSVVPTFSTQMTLYYMEEDKPRKLSAFYPVFPDSDAFKNEVKVLLSEFEDLSTDKKLDEIESYVSQFYGKPQKENLNDWLKENLDLEIKKETNFK